MVPGWVLLQPDNLPYGCGCVHSATATNAYAATGLPHQRFVLSVFKLCTYSTRLQTHFITRYAGASNTATYPKTAGNGRMHVKHGRRATSAGRKGTPDANAQALKTAVKGSLNIETNIPKSRKVCGTTVMDH